ncbi:hypothetical protein OOK41_31480 [Micromonospora sp. NBC_01655]|uniref:hypothetical protein n=1 Tax=Micromonospora sp. NBC_01655 TaxID=2975983 RepID=UPI0022546BE4|nr:hypothetical protein [Micromonospora sp. NBC_01655]MCX4474783.1 hypothetical protein [Micromonospora sp. NBC_01655]
MPWLSRCASTSSAAGASKTFKDVGDAAAKTGDEVAKLGTKATVAGEQVEGLGDKTRRSGKEADEAGDEYRGLAADIAVAEAAMRSLAAEIDRTGGKIIQDLNRQRSELRKLNNVQKLLRTWSSRARKRRPASPQRSWPESAR